MKYLKKYNEELRSSTYKRAADLLTKKGHRRRASVIKDWAKATKERENREVVDNCRKLGTFEMGLYDPKDIMNGSQLVSRKGQLMLKGSFYLNFYLDLEIWKENLREWKNGDRDNLYMTFHLGLIPANEDTKLEIEGSDYIDNVGGGPSDDGTYWISAFQLQITRLPYGDGIDPKDGLYIEPWELRPLFIDRRNAIKFINLIYGIFKGDIDHSSSVHPDTKEVIMDHLFDDVNITIEEFEELINSIKRTKVNSLYKD